MVTNKTWLAMRKRTAIQHWRERAPKGTGILLVGSPETPLGEQGTYCIRLIIQGKITFLYCHMLCWLLQLEGTESVFLYPRGEGQKLVEAISQAIWRSKTAYHLVKEAPGEVKN